MIVLGAATLVPRHWSWHWTTYASVRGLSQTERFSVALLFQLGYAGGRNGKLHVAAVPFSLIRLGNFRLLEAIIIALVGDRDSATALCFPLRLALSAVIVARAEF